MANLIYKQLAPSQAKKNLEENQNILLVDVREVGEYNAGHIEGAELISLGEIEYEFEQMDIEKDQVIYLYCRSGSRSSVAQDVLMDMGYTEVYNIGGVLNWPYDLVQ